MRARRSLGYVKKSPDPLTYQRLTVVLYLRKQNIPNVPQMSSVGRSFEVAFRFFVYGDIKRLQVPDKARARKVF